MSSLASLRFYGQAKESKGQVYFKVYFKARICRENVYIHVYGRH